MTLTQNINTEKVETLPTASPINYMKEYFNYCKLKKECEENDKPMPSFFNNVNTDSIDDNIKSMKKSIKMLEEKVLDMKNDLNDIYSLKYAEHIEPFPQKIVIHYCSNRSSTSEYYDLVSGCIITDFNNAYIIQINTKSESVYVPIGYVYKYGSLVARKYDIKVAPNNKNITTKNCGECMVDIFNESTVCANNSHYDYIGYYVKRQLLNKINAKDFVLNMFGRDISDMDKVFNLTDVGQFYRQNANFETIIKYAPINAIRVLAEIETTERKPIYQMLGISKESYNRAVELNIVDRLTQLRNYRLNLELRNIINLTDDEWIDLIVQSVEWEVDLDFYRIRYNGYYGGNDEILLKTLVSNYTQSQEFNKNYTFRKFCQYVVNATIDQGYSAIVDFIQHLRDYISMALKNNSEPIWETTYLKVSHDIAKRNFDIKVSEEQEALFKEAYKDFKPFTKNSFTLIAPRNTDDIKHEGNALNHCVASYIHRILKGETRIFFLRKANDTETPLCTVEIKDSKVCQYRGSHNRNLHKDELEFLKAFAEKRELEM